jgi:hypothetical protein
MIIPVKIISFAVLIYSRMATVLCSFNPELNKSHTPSYCKSHKKSRSSVFFYSNPPYSELIGLQMIPLFNKVFKNLDLIIYMYPKSWSNYCTVCIQNLDPTIVCIQNLDPTIVGPKSWSNYCRSLKYWSNYCTLGPENLDPTIVGLQNLDKLKYCRCPKYWSNYCNPPKSWSNYLSKILIYHK